VIGTLSYQLMRPLLAAERQVILTGMSDVTRILDAVEHGDPAAAEQLLPLVYDELRGLAAAQLARERPGQTLDATGLVHEAYLRLVGGEAAQSFSGRGHFFAVAAQAMRRILVDNARRKHAPRHGGGRQRVELDEGVPAPPGPGEDLLALNEALERLAAEDPLAARVVELRYFAGLSVEEAGEAAGLSRASAYRHWAFARAWLLHEMRGGGPG
jgi:RNA polymerase sigma factor (TIGR02999 family)